VSIENGRRGVPGPSLVVQDTAPENVKIAGLMAFYNERADFIVDGERQARPKPSSPKRKRLRQT